MSHLTSRRIPAPGQVLQAAFSPDDRFLAIAGVRPDKQPHERGFLQVYDASTLVVLHDEQTASSPLFHLAWSPDSTHLASAGQAGTVEIWDHARGTNTRTYCGHSPEVASLPLASHPVRRTVLALCWPSSEYLVSVGLDHCCCQWNPSSGQTMLRSIIYRDAPKYLSFSPRGDLLAVLHPEPGKKGWLDLDAPLDDGDLCPNRGHAVNASGKVSMVDVATAQTLSVLPGTESCLFNAWSPTTALLALGTRNEIQIWDLQRPEAPHLTRRIARNLFGGKASSYSYPSRPLVWASDGVHLAYCALTQDISPLSSRWSDPLRRRAQLEILDARTGTTVSIAPVAGASCLAWNAAMTKLVVGQEMEFEVLSNSLPLSPAGSAVDASVAS